MVDTHAVKALRDCRDLVSHDLGEPKYKTRHYERYRCPFHNEQHGYSLVVYDDHWVCFGKCKMGGDAITWMQRYHQMTFSEACDALVGGITWVPPHQQRESKPKPEPKKEQYPLATPPDEEWQTIARAIAERAAKTLFSDRGKRAMRYLTEQRGLKPEIIEQVGLGYVPGEYWEWREVEGVSVPCGITIPWYAEGDIWGIKVRRAAGEQRYQQVAGGKLRDGLYLADYIQTGRNALMTEGEFDALIALQEAYDLVSPVSIGSASNAPYNRRWWLLTISTRRIHIRMDDDEAGRRAAEAIMGVLSGCRSVQVPKGKDVNEFFLMEGREALREWIIRLQGRR
jgi:DNA primase